MWKGPKLEYLTSIVTTLSFAVLYGILEYYWIISDRDVPFRYGHTPIFMGFYLYHISVMMPIFFLVSFAPFIADLLGTSQIVEKWYTSVLGFATTALAVLVEDITWFAARVLNPLPLDPLAGKWIQATDWTARWISISVLSGVIPVWYCLIAIFTVIIWFCVFNHKTMERWYSR